MIYQAKCLVMIISNKLLSLKFNILQSMKIDVKFTNDTGQIVHHEINDTQNILLFDKMFKTLFGVPLADYSPNQIHQITQTKIKQSIIGMKTTIKDGSFMCTKFDGIIQHRSKTIQIIGHNQDLWTVVDSGEIFPSLDGQQQTDTKIRNDRNGEIWYCVASVSLDFECKNNYHIRRMKDIYLGL